MINISELLEKPYFRIKRRRFIAVYRRDINASFSKLSERKNLTKGQKREILAYFKGLTGERIPLDWHRYFYSRTGVYSKKYIPSGYYSAALIGRANNVKYRDAYVDKNMLDVILPDSLHPETILKNMNGYFFVGDEAVSREEAVSRCWNISDAVIKPTLECHGDGVHLLEVKDGQTNVDGLSLEALFDQYDRNWCIQKRIHQHAKISALNPSSVNTIRVLTYRSGMEILVMYSAIRIGREGQEVDNERAGGITTVIHPDGTLGKYAYGNPGEDKLEKTDNGIVLEGYQIPFFDKIIETVKEQHYCLPFFNLVGWDVTLNETGDPVIIEWNAGPELSQSAVGPAFGDYTERVIKEIWPRRNSRNIYW